ncbi:hypothetical protein M0R72_10000 [Candidatus Pacearchaeota archaeon]|jgi:hypothetical protein|nr:hypothetical protein [Candidatus Pacearchaeota archaeon]
MKNKTAAMEMSVGTIVTIVLSVTLLVLGIFFVQQIFSSAQSVVDLTDQQLRNEINQLFSDEDRISIYPSTRLIEIKQETTDGVGIGIKNLLTGASGDATFSYEITISDADLETKCGVDEAEVTGWIATGRAENDIPIPSGDISTQKVLFEIPTGAPLCTIRFRINVQADGETYATDFFDLKIKAK